MCCVPCLAQVVNERLSANCRARLTVENDDRASLYSVADLQLVHQLTGAPRTRARLHGSCAAGNKCCRVLHACVQGRIVCTHNTQTHFVRAGIPIVCDLHHWKFCPGGQSQEAALRAAIATWPAGVRPVVHWSESPELPGKKRNAHSGAAQPLSQDLQPACVLHARCMHDVRCRLLLLLGCAASSSLLCCALTAPVLVQSPRRAHPPDFVDGPINLYGLEGEVDVVIESKKELSLLAYREAVLQGWQQRPRARNWRGDGEPALDTPHPRLDAATSSSSSEGEEEEEADDGDESGSEQ